MAAGILFPFFIFTISKQRYAYNEQVLPLLNVAESRRQILIKIPVWN